MILTNREMFGVGIITHNMSL